MAQEKVLQKFDEIGSLSLAAAKLVAERAAEASASRGRFNIALAGGSTPKRLYEILAGDTYRQSIDWSSWHVYFGDERIVPLDDECSNYAMARKALLERVPIRSDQIYVPSVDAGSPAQVATAYEKVIRSSADTADETPRMDVVLLGLGSDGHTASLFPGKDALDDREHLITSSTPGVLPPPVDRITFTFPLINAARLVLFLAGGKDKAAAFRAAYHGESLGEVTQVPANRVAPQDGEVFWLVTNDMAEA